MKRNSGVVGIPKSSQVEPRDWIINIGLCGVLVDFHRHAAVIHSYYEPITDVSMARQMGMGSAQFWGPIHAAGPKFWENLPVYDWTDKIINTLNQSKRCSWRVVTTPTLDSTSKAGMKLLLAKRHIRGTLPTLYARDKSRYADSKSILIDDDPYVIDAFRRHGGHGILFPQPWNAALLNTVNVLMDPDWYIRYEVKRIIGATETGESTK